MEEANLPSGSPLESLHEPIPLLDHGYLKYIAHMGDDLTPLEAARMSTGNPTGVDHAKDAATRDYLWRHAHATPFEMAVLQIEVQCPLFVRSEWHRHRTQCLAGDTLLYFDLPGSKSRKKDNQLYKVRIEDFHRRWHEGGKLPIRKQKPAFAERIEVDRLYTIAELSSLVERRKEDLRNLVREGKLVATKEEASGNKPTIRVSGKAWLDYATRPFHASVPMRDRLSRMQLRMCDEPTGEIRHTSVIDVWQSGVKPTFKVTFENGKSITTSKDHRFYTEAGWMTLEQATGLKLGPSGSVSWRSEAPRFAANGKAAYRDAAWMASKRAEGLDIEAIASEAGCSYHTIRKWLKLHDLQFTAAERSRLSGLSQRGQKRTLKARPLSPETLARLREARSGAKSNFWKGGLSSGRANVARWTTQQATRVDARHDYTCLLCGTRGGKLHAHHLDPVWHNPALAQDPDNLVSLCSPCHRRLHQHHLELELLNAKHTGVALDEFFVRHGAPMPVPAGRRTATGRRTLVAHYVKVVSIDYAGEQMTYDLEVADPFHNFVADGMIVHNSFNEASGRYMEMPDIQYLPPLERMQPQSITNKQGSEGELSPEVRAEIRQRMHAEQRLVRENYEWYLQQGLAREVARVNMPLSQFTRFRAQANLRNWLHFLNLRMAPNAQYEIRVYAHALAGLIAKLWPETWAVFEEHTRKASTLSVTEREVLADLLDEALAGKAPEEREAWIAQVAGDRLSKARLRELLAKLDRP